MRMKSICQLVLYPKYPNALFKALEKEGGEGRRIKASVSLEGERVVIKIETTDATAMKAALNNYLRIAQTVEELEG